MTYYLLDRYGFGTDRLIKIKPEGITESLKELAEAAAKRENLKDVAVIFFHSTACSANQMHECMTYWEKFRSQTQ